MYEITKIQWNFIIEKEKCRYSLLVICKIMDNAIETDKDFKINVNTLNSIISF